jgi:hypothetical protein
MQNTSRISTVSLPKDSKNELKGSALSNLNADAKMAMEY